MSNILSKFIYFLFKLNVIQQFDGHILIKVNSKFDRKYYHLHVHLYVATINIGDLDC